MASAQSSPYTANQLKSRCRPTAKTTISTSASPIERHRMERIGGDRICESALTAASNMVALSSPIPSRELDMLAGFGKGKARRRLPRMTSPSFVSSAGRIAALSDALLVVALLCLQIALEGLICLTKRYRGNLGDADEHAEPAVIRGPRRGDDPHGDGADLRHDSGAAWRRGHQGRAARRRQDPQPGRHGNFVLS